MPFLLPNQQRQSTEGTHLLFVHCYKIISYWFLSILLWTVVGRTEPNLNDLGLAFDELHISLSELREYVENVDSKPFPYDVVEFPAPKSSCLFPVEQEPTAETRDGLGPSASQTELEGVMCDWFNFCTLVNANGWRIVIYLCLDCPSALFFINLRVIFIVWIRWK